MKKSTNEQPKTRSDDRDVNMLIHIPLTPTRERAHTYYAIQITIFFCIHFWRQTHSSSRLHQISSDILNNYCQIRNNMFRKTFNVFQPNELSTKATQVLNQSSLYFRFNLSLNYEKAKSIINVLQFWHKAFILTEFQFIKQT